MAYSDKVIDHYENPRNVGAFDKGDESVGTGTARPRGDVMKLQIKVGADGRIEDARFKTYGCGSAIASSSLVTEWVKGKTLEEAATIKNTQIAQELSLPPVKIHCSILAEDAIKAAVEDYKKSTNIREESKGCLMAFMATLRTPPATCSARSRSAARGSACASACAPRAAPASPQARVRRPGNPGDLEFESHGVKVLVDPKSLQYIDGTELDYTREGLNEGFKFRNPKVKDECGCGESFNVA